MLYLDEILSDSEAVGEAEAVAAAAPPSVAFCLFEREHFAYGTGVRSTIGSCGPACTGEIKVEGLSLVSLLSSRDVRFRVCLC